jgi:excisionase family DNA binding protein
MTTDNKTKDEVILLTVNEVAKLLRVSNTSIYRLAENGLLPFYRLRGYLRFDIKDINKFLDTNYCKTTRLPSS